MNNQLNPTEVQAWLDALNAQRTSLANEVVVLRGILALRDEEIANLKQNKQQQEVKVTN
jgi:hypothetical protein